LEAAAHTQSVLSRDRPAGRGSCGQQKSIFLRIPVKLSIILSIRKRNVTMKTSYRLSSQEQGESIMRLDRPISLMTVLAIVLFFSLGSIAKARKTGE
jgi:hypothetical protein